MAREEDEIRGEFKKLSEKELDIAVESSIEMKTFIEKVFNQKMLPKQAMGISDAQMEAYYALAYRLFNSGKYDKASWIFRYLIALNGTELKYTFGLAACLHMSKAYSEAVKAYTYCTLLDADDPIPCFHTSDCYIQMRDSASALLYLELAVKRAGEKQEYQVLKDRAKLTIQNLKKEMEEQAKAGEIPESTQPLETKMPWDL